MSINNLSPAEYYSKAAGHGDLGALMQGSSKIIPLGDSMMVNVSSSSLSSNKGDTRTPPTRHSTSGSSFGGGGGGGGGRDRPPSAQTTARPASARSVRSMRPSTAGGGGMGLLADVKVESRPVTHQGMMSVRPVVQGPGRQVMDKSYYLARLRGKKQELQAEMDVMSEEIERFQRCAPALAQLEHKRERLQEEVKTLQTQLEDYNLALEKVAAGMDQNQVEELAKTLMMKNEQTRKRIDEMFAECTRVDAETRDVEEKIPLLEVGLELQLDQETLRTRQRFLDLRAAHSQLTDEVRQLQREKDLVVSVPGGEALSHVVEGSREAVLARIRQDNIRIAQIESQCKELEAENQGLQERVCEASTNLSNLKGGKAEKFVEMQHKEERMQEFIDNFDKLQFDQENMLSNVQQKIQLLLEHIAAEMSLEGSFTIYPGLELQHPRDLQTKLNEHKSELRQHEELERNTDAQIADIKNNIRMLQRDVEKSAQSGLQSQQDSKSITIEVEKRTLEEQRRLVHLQIKEQTEKMNMMKDKLKESAQPHTDLEDLNKRIVLLEETNGRVKEEVEHKERQNNYQPIIENLKFMIDRLNDALKDIKCRDTSCITSSSKRSSGWYTRAEVSGHCTMLDLWVIIHGTVFDISHLVENNPPLLVEPLIMEAGGDISKWFNYDESELIKYNNPVTGKESYAQTTDVLTHIDLDNNICMDWYYTPQGRFIHVGPPSPRTDWDMSFEVPWWKDPKCIIGQISERTRLVRIKNVLVGQEYLLEVPSEETLGEILVRYIDVNQHASDCTWKANCAKGDGTFIKVDFDKTLEENGMPDERPEFESLEMGILYYLPCIHIYYNDDVTID